MASATATRAKRNRAVESALLGATVATTAKTTSTMSRMRCTGRGTKGNAAAGPSAVAAMSITTTPATTGRTLSSAWMAWYITIRPSPYSTIWWIQNGSFGVGSAAGTTASVAGRARGAPRRRGWPPVATCGSSHLVARSRRVSDPEDVVTEPLAARWPEVLAAIARQTMARVVMGRVLVGSTASTWVFDPPSPRFARAGLDLPDHLAALLELEELDDAWVGDGGALWLSPRRGPALRTRLLPDSGEATSIIERT